MPGENEKTGASVSGEITSVFTTVSCVNDYTASLKITKTVEGGPDNVGASKEFKFIVTAPNADENGTYPVTDNNNAASTVTFVNGKVEISITGSGSKTISGLRAGSYKETEDAASASVEGYNWSHSIDKDPVDVQAGGVTEVTVRNTYKAPEPETVSLSVDKVWNDEGSSANRPGSILVALRNGSGL